MRSKGILFLLLVLGLGILSGWLYTTQPYNFGLDVRGGVRFVYQMDTSKLTAEQKADMAGIRNRLITILGNRATGPLGVTEPTVVSKGTDQFVIELPGFTDVSKAESVIGTSARIEFYWAKNVQTERATFRPYIANSGSKESEPEVNFTSRSRPGEEIRYGTAEYANIIKGWELILSGDELARADVSVEGSRYQPVMNFSPAGAAKMERWSRDHLFGRENIAAVLDGRVLSIAGKVDGEILRENARITGEFTPEYVKRLTALLNAGALPVDLTQLSSERVDPTIGETALEQIVRAGAISFGLICLFLLGYYAFPGAVALVALCLYILFTLTVLKMINATFSLASIAGFILSVGMAVDANILVFERFKEEMKRGRTLNSAIHLGFNRALPAIIDSNACTILTSLVLVNLGTGPVKGFATTLIIGVLISLFTAVFVTRSLLMFLVSTGIGRNENAYALGRNWFGERFEATAETDPLPVVQKSRKWFTISLITVVVGLPFVFLGGFKPNVEFRGGSEAVFSLEGSDISSKQIVANLERAGFPGSNVKLGAVAPQNISILIPDPAKLTGTDAQKGEALADAAGLGGLVPTKLEATPEGALSVNFSSPGGKTTDDIEKSLSAAGFAGATVAKQTGEATERVAYVTVPPSEKLTALKSQDEKVKAVADAAGIEVGRNKGFTEIGPAVQQETIRNAVLGVILSSALIILYLAIRFGIGLGGFAAGLRFGLSAIGALVHDILVVLGITAMAGFFFGWEISALFITSMLTVIGFSVHDTIVIFDRIRENLHKPLPQEDFAHLVNRSITQSFARSINTSMTVIATLVILIAFGTATPDLKLFCVTMLAGIVSGTYSSIYNASPILYLWEKSLGKKKGEEFTLMGMARADQARNTVIRTQAGIPKIEIPNPVAPAASESESPSAEGTQPTPPPTNPTGRSYGQVRRRASDVGKKRPADFEDE